ncbi:importin 7 [Trypanosoma conorhini]|uniref:Importin 7 n=1 Tax=Trypanosoma conorhini TaxID=83891 RepID=A0A422PRP8_9TRYP|nr:importin 7 [Trypanosoma conorhini]RNF20412.1 importin 7 [Trypanosoma conorhini]
MDVLELLSVAYNGGKEERTAATAQLEGAIKSPDGPRLLVTLLRAGTDPALPAGQSLSALIYAKNCIMETLDDEQFSAAPGVLEEVKSLLYNGAFHVPSTHQKIIHTCVASIVSSFQWNYLPQLMPEISRERAGVTVEHAMAALGMLYVFVKRFKTPGLEPLPMKLTVCSCLISALPSFLSYGEPQVDHIVLKIMNGVVETALQGNKAQALPAEALDAWFHEMAQYPERHFVSASGAAASGSQKAYEAYVGCLKQIAMISFSVLNDATRKKNPAPVAKRFLAAHASAFLGVWQRWLKYASTSRERDGNRKADMYAIRYIKLCALDKTLYQQCLLPQLMPVVESLLFPYLCFSEEDEPAFADDGDLSEFAQYMMEEGFDQGEVSQRQAASNAIVALVKGNKDFHEDCLQRVIDFLIAGLSREDNDETFPQTFGYLHLLSVLRRHLRRVPEIWETQMAQVLVTFVTPRLAPTVPYAPLRCKALVACQRYSKAPIPAEADFAAFTQIVSSLVQDGDSRIRLGAIDALCTFLEMKRALPYIRPILVPLVEECISFLNRVQTSFVPTALLYLVEHFAPELISVLGKIGKTLVQHFLATAFDLAQQEAAMEDEHLSQYWRTELSACALLNALNTIVQASRHHMEVFCSLRPDLLLLAKNVLEHPDDFEFIENTLAILLNVVNFSKPIPPECWDVLPLLFQSVDSGVGVDFFVAIEEVLDSFISNGTAEFLQNAQLMEATYQACEKVLFHCLAGVEDQIAVPQLIEAMLHQAKHAEAAPGLFDAHLPRFVTLLLRALADDSIRQGEVRLQIWIIAALMDAFYYNAAATLQILASRNAYPQFFDALFHFFRAAIHPAKVAKGRKKRKHDAASEVVENLSILTRKVIVLGMTALLEHLFADGGGSSGTNLAAFDAYLSPTLALVQHCVFANDVLLASRCRIAAGNLEKVRQGVEVEDVCDVDLDDEDVLGVANGSDVATTDDDDADGGSDDEELGEEEIGHREDEGDDYESPIDDVCEVTLFLQWAAKATCLGGDVQRHLQTALSKSLQEFRDAEATALRYRQLVQELDLAMDAEHAARSVTAATS